MPNDNPNYVRKTTSQDEPKPAPLGMPEPPAQGHTATAFDATGDKRLNFENWKHELKISDVQAAVVRSLYTGLEDFDRRLLTRSEFDALIKRAGEP